MKQCAIWEFAREQINHDLGICSRAKNPFFHEHFARGRMGMLLVEETLFCSWKKASFARRIFAVCPWKKYKDLFLRETYFKNKCMDMHHSHPWAICVIYACKFYKNIYVISPGFDEIIYIQIHANYGKKDQAGDL